jgi:PAS domain S-box-containing protein
LRDKDLVSAASTVELNRRPSRAPNYFAENRALVDLADVMAGSPVRILQELSNAALQLCHAHSAGLSLLEAEDDRARFHWRAISGEWAAHVGGGTPREFGPCGTVLDRNMPLPFSHPERDFPYFAEVSPLIEEGLLLPFYVDGQPWGTLWVVLHDGSRHFDSEDLRVLTSLGKFAGAAYQTMLSVKATLASNKELKRSDAAMERFTAIVESSDDAILSMNLNGVIKSWNPGAERLFGYTAEEAVGNPIAMLIPAGRLDEEPGILARIRRGEHVDHYETRRVRKDGGLVDVSLTVSPIKDAAGRVIGASKIARDITDQKLSQARQDLLLGEMQHRVRNTFSMVQSIAMQTLRETSSEERASFIARLLSLSRAHDLLTKENWDRASLIDLVAGAVEPFRPDDPGRILVSGPQVRFDPGRAMLITMVVHEMATNAAKYGALSNSEGRVRITWDLDAEHPGVVNFHWRESGGPTVVPPKRRGFGSRLIAAAFKSESDRAELQFLAGGLVCSLRFGLVTAP